MVFVAYLVTDTRDDALAITIKLREINEPEWWSYESGIVVELMPFWVGDLPTYSSAYKAAMEAAGLTYG